MGVLKSIVNWELWQKTQEPRKIDTEYKSHTEPDFSEFKLTENEKPKKHKNVLGVDSDAIVRFCYLNESSLWVDSVSEKILNVNILIWKYDNTHFWI